MKVIVFILSVLVVFVQATPRLARTFEKEIDVDYNRDYQRDRHYDVSYVDVPEARLVEFDEYEIDVPGYEVVKETKIDIDYDRDVKRDRKYKKTIRVKRSVCKDC